MKNLLIYISPNKKLNPEHKLMLEVQIENSFDYWKKEDIVLAFNFPYEYRGVKATEVPDLINNQYPANPRAIINSKIDTIIYLLENKIITEPAWFHDFDAFQLAPFEVNLEKDLGLVRYGFYPERNLSPLPGVDNSKRINCGNIFFKPESLDIFKKVLEKMNKEGLFEEDAFSLMLEDIEPRVQIMNQTYNIGPRSIRKNYEISEKPIKVAHFPPHREQWFRKIKCILPEKLINLIDEKFKNKHILITGSKGFIGSHLLIYLKEKGFYAVGSTDDVRKDLNFEMAEIVIHTAAKVKGTDEELYETNVLGTKNVVEQCRKHGCRLIYLGTIETKGAYGQTKKQAENLVKTCQAITLKLPPIYTPEMLPARHGYYPMDKLLEDIKEIIQTHDFSQYYEKCFPLYKS